jgi:hypothetical protein
MFQGKEKKGFYYELPPSGGNEWRRCEASSITIHIPPEIVSVEDPF